MSNEFLSQDEVDALLKGVNGEEEAAPEATPEGPRPYNLATQERIVRGRMPTLDIINERFARLLRDGLFNFTRKSAEISIGPVEVVKYSEFLRNLVAPASLNIVQHKPLRGSSLVVFEPNLVFTVVDNMFGGDCRYPAPADGRDFTPTEQRIIGRMLEVVLETYNRAWQPVYPLKFEFSRAETHAQFVNIATPSEVVIASRFSIEIGTAGGNIHVCTPYSSVEPIRDMLYRGTQADSAEPDTRWLRMMTQQVQLAEVELVAQLAQTQVTLSQVLNMRKGDVVDLDLKPSLTAAVDGVPIFACRYGVLNGQYAVKVEKILAVPQSENMLGERNV